VVRTPEQIARERRRRARNHADKRFTYSSRYLKLLDYTFYITNVDVKTWEYPQVHTAYRIRWKVEIIFKSWKSYFHIDKLIHKQCCNYNRVQCTIFLMLLFITLFQLKLYHRFEKRIKKSIKDK
jgi:Transposase DDE domain